jgi:hypothetical protein
MLRGGTFWLHEKAALSSNATRLLWFLRCIWMATVYTWAHSGASAWDHNFFHGQGDTYVSLAFRKRIATTDGWVALGRFASHIMGGIGTNGQGKWGLFVDCILPRFGVLLSRLPV